jgi:CheY-like chemotaxis protein
LAQLEVVEAESGRAGIEAARQEQPDLILLDMIMPDMDGLATLALLRSDPRTADIPVFFLTACREADGWPHPALLGAQGVFPKPFNPQSLAAQVLAWLRGH